MIIGVSKEIKNNENRVAMTPASVLSYINAGHTVLVEKNAGLGSNFHDDDYIQAGAKIVETAQEAWDAEMVVKVKEPIASEYQYFREGLLLFTYLHLANEPELTEALVKNKVNSVAYETVELDDRSLPLLSPMSEVAGRMATQIGAQFLQKIHGGMGVLLSGVPGVERSNVTIIGGGMAGTNAAKIAIGLGAKVTILDLNLHRLRELDDIFGNDVTTLMSNDFNIEESVKNSDLVIGAVLIPGAKAPKLVKEHMVKQMKPGSVLVDVAIDQGGIFETSDRVTTHDNPTYEKYGVVHYAVANMPGAVPRTSTMALTNATLQYGLKLANQGLIQAVTNDFHLYKGVNTFEGNVTYQAVARDLGYDYKELSALLNNTTAK
ncbi:alanine dehydrogenase [Listeria fleischmannii]|uniref:Alanine dehydrogenase n=1 Tax=Listeria fleischmannii TaxID=1069827 RepID=A0A841YBE6_9LIST|nr:alanine dehydrogenase [Listeria fleischmannii]EIA19103.1 alanine dehydrogenase [Listeria fleischmannii subsp. coloradonensis]MBC1397519.1 alanine dehydrogenase [Listeria fleischmannii]MBC1425888.1 alanine dehydrogenase [Listeria fleischmannii]STY35093.1 Alanine dehydrogenase 2 [Listeria fleischmannii subsp. coloradonensis]